MFEFLGIGKAKDPVCGMSVDKKSAIQRNGQYFCSEGCAKSFEEQPTQKTGETKHGCC